MREKRIGTVLVTVVPEASQQEVCPPQRQKKKNRLLVCGAWKQFKFPSIPQGKFSSFLAPFVVYLIPNI
jgi:hypothetical protein